MSEVTTKEQIKTIIKPFVKPDDVAPLADYLTRFFFTEVVNRAVDFRAKIEQVIKENYESYIDSTTPSSPDE